VISDAVDGYVASQMMALLWYVASQVLVLWYLASLKLMLLWYVASLLLVLRQYLAVKLTKPSLVCDITDGGIVVECDIFCRLVLD
jgi:hypothetical protein